MNKTPDFIIIGAMKCATSTLHEQLALQPGIFMSKLKEPNFFSNNEEYQKGWNWYLSNFASAPVEALSGESSTHYTKLPTYPETIQRIQQHLPQAKFIYVMRHPIDRLVSQYIHEWTQKVISEDINTAITNHPELIDYSCYTMQLQQEELERVCQFIGYAKKPIWNFELEAQNVSQERIRKSVWRDILVETPGLRELRRLFIPKSFRTWVKSWWEIKQKPELTPENIETKLGIELCCKNFKSMVKNQAFNWV